MFERSELRSRREERMKNGVKNLMGNESIPKTFANFGFGNASLSSFEIDFNTLFFYSTF
jgi:hypothetical protein